MKPKSKLIILNHYAYAPDQGAGTRHYEMARHFNESGRETIIISCAFFHKKCIYRDGARGRIVTQENIDGVDYRWLWGSAYSRNGIRRFLNMLTFSLIAFFYVIRVSRAGDVILLSSP